MIDKSGLPPSVAAKVEPEGLLGFYLEARTPQAAEFRLDLMKRMAKAFGPHYDVIVLVVWYGYTMPGAFSYLGLPFPESDEYLIGLFDTLLGFAIELEDRMKEQCIIGRYMAEFGEPDELNESETGRLGSGPRLAGRKKR